MSSVGSSDSSNASTPTSRQDDAIRRTREAATNGEAEEAKKHAREIRRINEAHYAELENLKKSHSEQLAELKKNSNDYINERDHKYQNEVEELRGLYRKQLQGQADESRGRDEALRKAGADDFNLEKAHGSQQVDRLSKEYETNLRQRENSFGDDLKEVRESEKTAIVSNTEKIARQYDDQTKLLRDERNEKVGAVQKAHEDYRQSNEARAREMEVRQFEARQKASDALLHAVNKERFMAQDTQETMRDGYRDSLAKMRERFDKASGNNRETGQQAQENLRATVEDRIHNQVERLQANNDELRDVGVRQQMQYKAENRRDFSAISDAAQKNIESYRENRDDAVRMGNERVHSTAEKLHKEFDKQAIETNRGYRNRQDEQSHIARTAYENLKGDFENRNDQQRVIGEKKLKTLFEATTEDQARMTEQNIDNHAANQRQHQDEMKALRMNLEEDKQTAVNLLQDRLQKQELQHSERMTQVVSKYEKQLQQLKDQMIHEKKSNDENMKRTVDELQRANKVAMDQLTSQNRDRMRLVDQQHSEELRNLNKRNDEKIDQVLTEVKRT